MIHDDFGMHRTGICLSGPFLLLACHTRGRPGDRSRMLVIVLSVGVVNHLSLRDRCRGGGCCRGD